MDISLYKRSKAIEHYYALYDLFSEPKYICMKEMLPPKEQFVSEYPLSIIGICTTRKFWEVCYELGIVTHFFQDKSEFNEFEKELHDLCEKYMSSYPEDFTTEEFKKEVEELFKKYKICYKC